MGIKFLSAAVMVAVLGAPAVHAQSVRQVGGPANLPPAGFQGEQWVDSRGCVFLKAGYGGQVTWVPRVGRDRKALCGYPPMGSTRDQIEVATAEDMAKPATVVVEAPVAESPVADAPVADAAVAAEPKVVAAVASVQKPIPAGKPVLAASAPMPAKPVAVVPRQPAPYAEAAPRLASSEVATASGPGRGKIGCYTSAPVAERVRTSDGGTAVVCTRGDGSMTGWRPPIYPRQAGVGAALGDPAVVSRGAVPQGGVSTQGAGPAYARAASDDAIPTPPAGYKLAWDDDRLNPNRGKGTSSGWAAQDQVWTRKVPSGLVADQPGMLRKKKIVYVQTAGQVTVSSKSQPAAPVAGKAAKGGVYVQVGTFGVAGNADGAASRLKGMGLPVARAKIASGGQPAQIVLAGPFGSAAEAQTALAMAQQAGFGDAFLR